MNNIIFLRSILGDGREPEERNLTKQWADALIPNCKVRGNFLTLNPNGTSP